MKVDEGEMERLPVDEGTCRRDEGDEGRTFVANEMERLRMEERRTAQNSDYIKFFTRSSATGLFLVGETYSLIRLHRDRTLHRRLHLSVNREVASNILDLALPNRQSSLISGRASMGSDNCNWHSDLDYDQWVALPVAGPRPLARYKHAAVVIDEKLYIVGGSRNGRYLSDVQALDLRNLSWSTIKLSTQSEADNIRDGRLLEVFPAISGHSMLKWGNRLLLLGGHSKDTSDNITVRFIDLESRVSGVMEATGKIPVARGGQSVSLVGSKLIMFGGEDRQRRLLNDVNVLDLETMIWNVAETTQSPPAPRFDHTAAVHVDRYLQIFGGCSHSTFFNDLHVLDLETAAKLLKLDKVVVQLKRSSLMVEPEQLLYVCGGDEGMYFYSSLTMGLKNEIEEEHISFSTVKSNIGLRRLVNASDDKISLVLQLEWSHPQVQGNLVSPRAGHAGVSIDEKWFIVGGGDNKSGALETLVLDMSKLILSVLTSVERRDPLASEGITISSAVVDGEQFLVAFGGYNGNYNNEVFAMKPKPKDSKHPKIVKSSAAAAAAASVTAAYALAKSESLDLTSIENSKTKVDLSVEIGVIKEEKKVLESSIAWVKAEKSTLNAKLDEINETHADLSKKLIFFINLLQELHSVQGQLAAEKSRCANLETQISELQKMLLSMQDIEQKVQALRSQNSAFEHHTTVQRQSSGGVWRWMAP
ncbi:Galactose oxidase/kelch, beta-propeller [Cynara cardunculus var. scolymus]|uniref:Galactose oxidase/kelch, beta-propeller n=1 Tax=Cynara cardunculus var. scolymus TaxID=59895 RepID=A0A103Y9H9_CYNCS|nr:Galactose oxidase/kelch, beta-propeller [Cynara cardunculus var. scolymus]